MSNFKHGRAGHMRNMQPGEYALSIGSSTQTELLIRVDSKDPERAAIVTIRNKADYLIAEYSRLLSLGSAKRIWILPPDAMMLPDYSSVRIPQHLHEMREAALVLDKNGKTYCRLQDAVWFCFTDNKLVSDVDEGQLELVEFSRWSIVSGPSEARAVHFDARVTGTGELPWELRQY